MKTINVKTLLAGLLLNILFFSFQSCKKEITADTNIMPESFSVEIPGAMTQAYSSQKMKSASDDTLNGGDVYAHLGNFINLGKGSADIVQAIISAIHAYNLSQPASFSYVSDEDYRSKNVVIIENSDFEGESWAYQMTITDALSESSADSGNALQIFWNKNPVKGIAILKPYNINRSGSALYPDAMFRIDYSEAGEYGYDKHMIVSIAGLPLADPLVDPYSVNSLKMFVGKSGDIVDMRGNSNHPNAIFFTSQTGFDWAFTASGNLTDDVGVAEVGLPPYNLDEISRTVLLEDYSIKNVFEQQIYAYWPSIDSTSVNSFLYNTEAPGYFDQDGFVQGGLAPSSQYAILESRIKNLSPYNPKDIAEQVLIFK
jgi:hypothetical protein